MKNSFAALLPPFPADACAGAEYYTLPEIREQAKDGWHRDVHR